MLSANDEQPGESREIIDAEPHRAPKADAFREQLDNDADTKEAAGDVFSTGTAKHEAAGGTREFPMDPNRRPDYSQESWLKKGNRVLKEVKQIIEGYIKYGYLEEVSFQQLQEILKNLGVQLVEAEGEDRDAAVAIFAKDVYPEAHIFQLFAFKPLASITPETRSWVEKNYGSLFLASAGDTTMGEHVDPLSNTVWYLFSTKKFSS